MTEELYHHGIKGQKWGVRRFQNKDGSLTTAGRKRYSEDEKKQIDKEKAKKIATAALLTGTVAAAAYVYSKNNVTVNIAVERAMKEVGKQTLKASKKVASVGKEYINAITEGTKEGVSKIPEGIKTGLTNAPKKVAQGLAEGAGIIATKKILDNTLGQGSYNTAIGAYNAYNKKNKIGKVNYKKKDDEEDDD